MAMPRSALATRSSPRRFVMLMVLLGTLSVLGGCPAPLPKDTPEAVRRFLELPQAEQRRTLGRYPPAMQVELACTQWRHVHQANGGLVEALASTGCVVIPSIDSALARETDGAFIAHLLINALAEMDLASCDSMAVRAVMRTASAKLASVSDSYYKQKAQKYLAAVERVVSH